MRRTFKTQFIIMMVGMLFSTPSIHGEEYATKQLAHIATEVAKQKPKYAITTRSNAYGEVEHIGLRLFGDVTRKKLPSPSYDFLERFLLEVNMAKGEDRDRLLMQNFVTFNTGTPATALTLDTLTTYEEEKLPNTRYMSTWKKNGKVVLQMMYPMDWQMLTGCSIDELEKNFEKKLLRHNIQKVDTLPLRGTYIMSPLIKNDIYLSDKGVKTASGRRYVFNVKNISKSVANMMLVEEMPVDVDLRMSVNRYDYITDSLTVPLRKYINFCMTEEGCKPYFGLKSVKDNVVKGVLFFVNSNGGFMHMLSVTVNYDIVKKAKGTIKAKLLPYIPLHNVKKEYLNLTEYETVE